MKPPEVPQRFLRMRTSLQESAGVHGRLFRPQREHAAFARGLEPSGSAHHCHIRFEVIRSPPVGHADPRDPSADADFPHGTCECIFSRSSHRTVCVYS